MIQILLFLCLFSSNVFAHGGDDGPSSLVEEFAKNSHVHLPVSYSPGRGLSYGWHLGGEHEEEHHEEDVHADETGLEITIHPQVLGGFDKVRRLINQENSLSAGFNVEPASEHTAYILVENRKWDLGFGFEGETHLPVPLFAAGIGISFLKGKNYYTSRVLNSRNEQRQRLELPFDEASLQSWRPGDELSYSTKGSLILNAIVGIDPIVHFGPLYSHSGTYRFKAVMESAGILQVEIATIKSDTISIEASAVIASGEAGKSRGHAEVIVYDFDLMNPDVYSAIKALFYGRLDVVNKALLTSGGSIHLRTNLHNTSTYATGNFGLPFIYFNGRGQGVYQNQGVIEDVEDNETTEIFSTTSTRERFTRGVLSRHHWENQSAVSTILKGESSLITTVLSWSFSNDSMSSYKLEAKLKNLADIFGVEWLKQVRVPQEKLGYVKADFNLNLSGQDILHLLNGDEIKKLEKSALELLEKDFKLKGRKAFCRVRTYSNCLKRYKNLITYKISKIKASRRLLEKSYKDKKLTAVTSRLNEVVQSLFSSRYLTYAFREVRRELKAELRLEGEKIKKHTFPSAAAY